MSALPALPALAAGLCDDAAVFPPGSLPLPEAVPAHRRHRSAPYAGMVGPFIVAAPALGDLGALVAPGDRFDLVVTVPAGPEHVPAVLEEAAALPLALAGIEVAVPAGTSPAELFAALDRAGAAVPVFVEVPRDERRPEIIAALPGTPYRAKFRTGGITADLHPDEAELAAAIGAVVAAGVPFKATAGLHHAIRRTEPGTGFEQHGFLNLMLAVDAALGGAPEEELAAILARRDGAAVAAAVAALDGGRIAAVRERFLSFGTCSITDPLNDLIGLGLVPGSMLRGGESA
ncbi:hypothetical protein ACFY4C_24555 [Actinomadura viridis]|uniref:hypothetical protein n=1 Tax=Actinomadura viridis TaxID=58110 RepID=UPI0036C524C2